jgi:hypothetical protein
LAVAVVGPTLYCLLPYQFIDELNRYTVMRNRRVLCTVILYSFLMITLIALLLLLLLFACIVVQRNRLLCSKCRRRDVSQQQQVLQIHPTVVKLFAFFVGEDSLLGIGHAHCQVYKIYRPTILSLARIGAVNVMTVKQETIAPVLISLSILIFFWKKCSMRKPGVRLQRRNQCQLTGRSS